MPARSSCGVVRVVCSAVCLVVCVVVAACSAADTSVDPGDLELRDVLGISPDVAADWGAAQRAAGRRVLDGGLRGDDATAWQGTVAGDVDTLDVRVAQLLAVGDAARAADGLPALGVVRVVIQASPVTAAPTTNSRTAAPAPQTDSPTAAPAAVEPHRVVDIAPQGPHRVVDIAPQGPHPAAPAPQTDSPTAAPAAIEPRRIAEIVSRPARLAAGVLAASTPAAEPLAAAHPHTAGALALAQPTASGAAGPPGAPARVELRFVGWNLGRRWEALSDRGTDLLAALAADAGHPGGPLAVVPAPRLAVVAAYVRRDDDRAPPHLLINPVALAVIEPGPAGSDAAGPSSAGAALGRSGAVEVARSSAIPAVTVPHGGAAAPVAGTTVTASTGGNPYSFYGSVAECAFAQRTRCEACLPASNCRPITNISDGNAECTMLGAESGRGYFLLCINLALAISSVDACTGDAAPACVRDPNAADTLATLENNADFLSDPSCGGALDGCLAKIYGTPGGQFPGLDAGTTSSEPPRSTSVSCGNSCNNNNQNTSCNASPSCDCSGPSCNNSLSCDSACSSSNDQRGCGGNCNACTSSGGGGGNDGGGCGGGSSSSSGGSCSGGSSGSNSSGCGNSCSSSSSGGNSGCSGGGCSSGSGSGSGCSGGGCSSGSGGSSCGGSGGGSKCSVAAADPGPGIGFVLSAVWGGLPIVLAAFARRRAHRRSRPRPGDPRDPASAQPGQPLDAAHDTPRPQSSQPLDAAHDAPSPRSRRPLDAVHDTPSSHSSQSLDAAHDAPSPRSRRPLDAAHATPSSHSSQSLDTAPAAGASTEGEP